MEIIIGVVGLALVVLHFWCLISIDRKLGIGNQYLEAIHKALTTQDPNND